MVFIDSVKYPSILLLMLNGFKKFLRIPDIPYMKNSAKNTFQLPPNSPSSVHTNSTIPIAYIPVNRFISSGDTGPFASDGNGFLLETFANASCHSLIFNIEPYLDR